MEYKRMWIPYDTDFSKPLMYVFPSDNEDTNNADEEIKHLLKVGWHIISTAPITESRAYNKEGNCDLPGAGGSDMVYTFTSGIEVFLVKE